MNHGVAEVNRIHKLSKKTSRATSNHGVVLTWEGVALGGCPMRFPWI